ncbi:MAG: hypothetical protein F4045_02070 [Chloroflexi bacterium]|nr:hypothetical protein [Chloroflexota bacterium]MYF79058.1 hypothetical protein [Chloroflexota bacterium]MYK33921.1 hypothetical protein [Chloroflexota bacterium]
MNATSLPHRIMNHAAVLPEGALLFPATLLHLGNRAAVDQALSRLARSGRLLRICQGIYALPVETRFGQRSPSVEKVLASLSELWGETIVPSGGASANALGLTTQMQVHPVYLTSGASRTLRFGRQVVRLHHAPRWQLAAPNRFAGAAIRALVWLGPQAVEENLEAIRRTVPASDFDELGNARHRMPEWITKPLNAMLAHG